MTRDEFVQFLVAVADPAPVFAFEALGDPDGTHVVWQEMGSTHAYGDDHITETVRAYQIDVFALSGSEELADRIVTALDDAGAAVEDGPVLWDSDAGMERHIVRCEVI